jgi:uncharacterized repeat protein (TIGR02543 family)
MGCVTHGLNFGGVVGRWFSHLFVSFFIPIVVSILILFIHTPKVYSAQMTLAWDPNTEPNLAGYKVYYGTGSSVYGSSINVGNVTSYTLVNLPQGQTYFVSVTAYDTSNKESDYSNEVSGVAKEPTQTYTVTTNPSGLQITVDGVIYTAPQSFSWAVGSSHTVSVSSLQAGGSGVRYVYSSWSDGEKQSHTITAPSSSTTYTASFNTEYRLTTLVHSSGEGVVTPSGANWYNSGQSVSISVTAHPGYNFSGWSGDASGTSNPITLNMNANKTVTANLTTTPGSLSVNPSEGLVASGNLGGPFSPSIKTYMLQNTGQSGINWSASKGESWISLSKSNGSLIPGQTTKVVVSINRYAKRLGEGKYNDIITFNNLTNGNGNTSYSVELTVSMPVETDVEPDQDTHPIDGSWIFEISGMDKGGVAIWFGNNALYGYGISLERGMFEIEGSYDVDSEGSINGTYILYDFVSLAELGKGNFTGKAGKEVARLKFEMETLNEKPLSINMKGGRLIEEPAIPVDCMAKMKGSRKGTLDPLKIEPYQLDGEIYPHVFKVSGPGLIREMGPIEMRGYFFLTLKNRVYGIYEFSGAASETGVFSGRLDPVSGIFNLKLMNEEGDNGNPTGQVKP